MRKQAVYEPELEDWLFHCVFPFAAYALIVMASFTASDHTRGALFAIGTAVLLLLFIGIHNAWDGITYHVLVHQSKPGSERSEDVDDKKGL